MKAVVYSKPMQVSVEEFEAPQIQEETDVVVRVTSSAICGSDLHMFEGHTTAEEGMRFGHEIMGIVEDVGGAVKLIKKGDRVVMPFNVSCGVCRNCVRQFTNACLTTNPETAGGGYGYVGLGPYPGGQAEYVRVPYADWACLKLPGEAGDDLEEDFILLADIFPTGYHATEQAQVGCGKTVAVFGAGPVGLLAAYSAKLKGASEIYVVDKSQARLNKVREIGAIPIDFTEGDPVEQIKQLRKQNQLLTDALRPGEEKMSGVDCGIDAVGYQAFSREHTDEYDAQQILADLARLVNPTGFVSLIGVYVPDPKKLKNYNEQGVVPFPLADFWQKGITIGMGQCPVKKYQYQLRDLIINGARPSFIVTHRIKIEDAPETYRRFDERDEVVKAVISFV